MSKKLKIFIPVYILFLLLSFLYIRSVLKESPLDTQDEEKEVEDVYPITVSLRFINNGVTKAYNANFENIDTVTDLMEDLRDHQELIYEKTEYFKKTTIDSVNGIIPPKGYRWGIFMGDIEYTNDLGSTQLVNNATYELKIVKE